jgi:hypothetical protein
MAVAVAEQMSLMVPPVRWAQVRKQMVQVAVAATQTFFSQRRPPTPIIQESSSQLPGERSLGQLLERSMEESGQMVEVAAL